MIVLILQKEHFDVEVVLKNFQEKFPNIKISRALKDTILADIDGVSFSLFYYPYEVLHSPSMFRTIQIASLADIAAMKMVAVSMRGKSRDFIDVYFLLKKFSLKQMIGFTLKKYPAFQEMSILKGLVYFEDVDREEDIQRGIKIFDKSFDWKVAKMEIIRKVKEYQAAMLKFDF